MIKQNIHYRFGDKLREVRERRKITLKQVAEKANVSESLVSQIERNKVSPSIDTLLIIADVLEIDLDYLFKDYKRKKSVDIVRKDNRNSILTPGIVYSQLSVMSDETDKHAIEAFILDIQPGSEKGSSEYGHTGKELGYVLKGKGELIYGDETYIINEGDSVTFTSDIPHILKNNGKGVLRVIWIITPPKMFFFNK